MLDVKNAYTTNDLDYFHLVQELSTDQYHISKIFLYIMVQLSRLNWWDDFIKLTEDTKYIACEDQPGDPGPHCLIVWNNRQGPPEEVGGFASGQSH